MPKTPRHQVASSGPSKEKVSHITWIILCQLKLMLSLATPPNPESYLNSITKYYKKGDPEDKKVTFKAIGLNPILLDQKLEFRLLF